MVVAGHSRDGPSAWILILKLETDFLTPFTYISISQDLIVKKKLNVQYIAVKIARVRVCIDLLNSFHGFYNILSSWE